ncbi:MAG TPA: hypothetical protein VGQ39_15270 [Pyrinomonadaceae bacterium]|jgi:hypothetical protein|nr:hypothetical protein [Pyrinomonadaceae bacterium]
MSIQRFPNVVGLEELITTIGGEQMKYLLLIYHDEQAFMRLTEDERQEIYRE